MALTFLKACESKLAAHYFLLSHIRKLSVNTLTKDEGESPIIRPHTPVMVHEVIEYLNAKPGDVFLDMTFGAGGHSQALLDRIPNLRVLALDRDPTVEKYVRELSEKYPNQITSLVGKFSELSCILEEKNIKKNTIDCALFDLGCSSMQFDDPERGFSMSKTGPLDMRMDGGRVPNSITAADVVAYASEKELIQIFKIYGEEKRAKKIARAIQEARFTFAPLTTTRDLCDLIEAVCSEVRYDKLNRKAHTATKIFQALRIFVNNELNELNQGVNLVYQYLKPGGRAVAISFHSLEDTILKRHFNNQNAVFHSGTLPLSYVNFSKTHFEEMADYNKKIWKALNKKVVLPTEEEISDNPRSRSAKLRAAFKL